jgi:hypothetical protein
VTLQRYFTSKFSYIFFCKPTHKIETGTANSWGSTNSKPPAPIITLGQSETLSSSEIIFIKLFSPGAQHCCAFHQPQQTAHYDEPKPFSSAKPAYFDFSSSNFAVWNHILSTAGDALTTQEQGSSGSKHQPRGSGQIAGVLTFGTLAL